MFYRVHFGCNFVGCEQWEIIEAESTEEAEDIANDMMMDIIGPFFTIEGQGETEEEAEEIDL